MIETKVIAFTFGQNANQKVIQDKFSPGPGEIWYVNTIRLESDNSGNNYDLYLDAHIGSAGNEANIDSSSVDEVSPSTGIIVRADNYTAKISTVDEYISDGDVLYSVSGDGGQSGSGIGYAIVELRRVV